METTYVVRTVTSNKSSAGTDANVFIDLIGTNGSTGNLFLKVNHIQLIWKCVFFKLNKRQNSAQKLKDQ